MSLNDNTAKITSLTAAINNLPDIGGIYKAMFESNVKEIVDESVSMVRAYCQYGNSVLEKVSLPNVVSVGHGAFRTCPSLTGIINLPKAVCDAAPFQGSLKNTCVIHVAELSNQGLYQIQAPYVWLPDETIISGTGAFVGGAALRALQLDKTTQITSAAVSAASFTTLVLRTPTVVSLSQASIIQSRTTVYVPESLLTQYSTETNWVSAYNAGHIIPIVEDVNVELGTTFTPQRTQGVVEWYEEPLQSYTMGTVDVDTGAITATSEGRILIVGYGDEGYAVSASYLQVGSGFDEDSNK